MTESPPSAGDGQAPPPPPDRGMARHGRALERLTRSPRAIGCSCTVSSSYASTGAGGFYRGGHPKERGSPSRVVNGSKNPSRAREGHGPGRSVSPVSPRL